MTNKLLRFTILAALSLPLFGQTDVARIVGTVTDSSGAVIPAANVTIKSERTGETRKLTSNEQGLYVGAQLPPSRYSVKIEAPGMAATEYTGIPLQVGQERTLNVVLQPNTLTTEINVSGGDLTVIDFSSAANRRECQ